MSWKPDCTCGHNLIDHWDVMDEGEVEGLCRYSSDCHCQGFTWDREPNPYGESSISPAIAVMNQKSLSSRKDL